MFGGLGQLFAAATITKWGRAKQQTNEYVYGNASETFGLGVSVDLSVAVQKNKFAGTTDTTTSFTLIKADDEHGVMRKGMVDDFDRLFKAAKSIGLIRRPEGFNKGWEIDGAPELGSWDVEGELKLSLYQNEQLKRALVRRVIDLTVRNTVAALSGLKQKAKK